MKGHSNPQHRKEEYRKENTDALFSFLDKKQIEFINFLIVENEGDVDYTQVIRIDNYNYTPLHFAAHQKLWGVVAIIAQRIQLTHLPIDDEDSLQYGATVMRAVDAEQMEIVQLLLKYRPLPTTYFAKVSAQQLLNMMLQDIKLTHQSYHHENLQSKRKQVLKLLLTLGDVNALKMAKDKNSVLGDYLLNYSRGFFAEFLFGRDEELSAESMEKQIDQALAALRPRPRASTTEMFSYFDFYFDLDDKEVEFVLLDLSPANEFKPHAEQTTSAFNSDESSLDSASFDEVTVQKIRL